MNRTDAELGELVKLTYGKASGRYQITENLPAGFQHLFNRQQRRQARKGRQRSQDERPEARDAGIVQRFHDRHTLSVIAIDKGHNDQTVVDHHAGEGQRGRTSKEWSNPSP